MQKKRLLDSETYQMSNEMNRFRTRNFSIELLYLSPLHSSMIARPSREAYYVVWKA